MSQISELVKQHGGSDSDGVSAVGCAMASFRWWDQWLGVGFQLSCSQSGGLKLWV